jgi:hypothetical protein
VATIDFYKETKQNARLVSVRRVEEDMEWKLIKLKLMVKVIL